jgi:hypothetical protein
MPGGLAKLWRRFENLPLFSCRQLDIAYKRDHAAMPIQPELEKYIDLTHGHEIPHLSRGEAVLRY